MHIRKTFICQLLTIIYTTQRVNIPLDVHNKPLLEKVAESEGDPFR